MMYPTDGSRRSTNSFGEIMRKFIGWAASWTFYYLSGGVDLIRARFEANRLTPVYSWLRNASDDAQTWGGGRGTWGYGLPVENEYWRDFCVGNNQYSRVLAQRKLGRETTARNARRM
jgi:hypothetical protein